jgi:hypothetical protein
MSMEQWWNDDYQGKTEEQEKNLLQCHFVHRESHLKSLVIHLAQDRVQVLASTVMNLRVP